MALATNKGTATYQQPTGGAWLAPEGLLVSYVITAPLDNGSPTGFSTLIPGITVEDSKIVGCVPISATAAALAAQYVVTTAGIVSIYFTASNLQGNEKWNLTVLQQA